MSITNWNSLVNPGVLDIKPYVPGKSIMEVAREKGITNIIKMASNENPLGMSPGAMRSIKEHLDESFQYPEVTSLILREKLGEKLDIPSENILVGNGGDGIIYSLIMGLVDQGEEVIIPEITFAMYEPIVKTMRGRVVLSKLKEMAIDLEDILSRISGKTKMIWLCNPNNPTGLLTKEKDLLPFLAQIPDNVIIVHDEVYCDFVPKGDFPDLLPEIRNKRKNLFLVRSFSKVYGMAGMRVGYGLGDKDLINILYRVKPPFEVSVPAQVGAIGALDDDEFYEKTVKHIALEKEFLYQSLDNMGISYLPSATNFITINVGMDGYEVFNRMMEEGIIIRPLTSYALPEYIRVTIGLREWNIRFIKALKKILSGATK